MAGLAAGALWGLVFVAPALAPGLLPVDLAAGRFAVFGPISLLIVSVGHFRGRSRMPTWHQAGAAALLSALGFSGYYLLLVYAIRDAGMAVPTMIIGTVPVWVMLLGKPVGLRWQSLIPGLLLTLTGVALMMVADSASSADARPHGWVFWRGVLYGLLAMASWVVFAILNSAWLKRHTGVQVADWTSWMGVSSGVAAVALWGLMGTPLELLLAHTDIARAAMVCIANGVGSAWVATMLWNFASRRLSASLCGQLIVSETLFALFYAFLVRGDWPHLLQWWASGTFLLGLVASVRAHR
ncbi:RhaT Permeases of the drug/metabolite transporter (DMT) superfamily [Comamonadaceae bacterium]